MPGFELRKLENWLATLPIDGRLPIELELAGDGKSNITAIATTEDGHRYVLRRPPLGHLLPTAHDVAREFRILSALGGTDVPVPLAIALTEDPIFTDAPLMIMEHVDGVVLNGLSRAKAATPEFRRDLGRSLIDALAAVHSVDLDATGLVDLASHRPLAARQLKRWRAQWEESRTREETRVESLADRLTAAMPRTERLTLVHGDYHLGNVIVHQTSGYVQAVIDWELSTLGEPLADLGLLLAYWTEAGDPPGQPTEVSALPGFPTRHELVELYTERTGRDPAEIGYWEVLGLWKVAIILEGVRRRGLDDVRNAERGATFPQSAIDAVIDRAWSRADAVGL